MPDPTLLLRPCTPSDIPALAAVNASFTSPRVQLTYGNVSPSDRLKLLSSILSREFQLASTSSSAQSQQTHIICVVDTAINAIISFAVWIYQSKGYLASEDVDTSNPWLPPGTHEVLARDFQRMAGELRSAYPARVSEPHWMLANLATRPEHEGRGAGSMLIRWAFPRADEMGVKCFVDSSAVGYPVYKKRGFVDVGIMEVDFDRYEGGKGMGVQKWVAMMREPEKGGKDEGDGEKERATEGI
ncbi:hypothetical protein G7Y79_00021g050290 [Physcia stellaris]|nr:hypothetical protein G7Y79_00021g050290 [Physcia stellaris]